MYVCIYINVYTDILYIYIYVCMSNAIPEIQYMRRAGAISKTPSSTSTPGNSIPENFLPEKSIPETIPETPSGKLPLLSVPRNHTRNFVFLFRVCFRVWRGSVRSRGGLEGSMLDLDTRHPSILEPLHI
jgi:hypothetical protein